MKCEDEESGALVSNNEPFDAYNGYLCDSFRLVRVSFANVSEKDIGKLLHLVDGIRSCRNYSGTITHELWSSWFLDDGASIYDHIDLVVGRLDRLADIRAIDCRKILQINDTQDTAYAGVDVKPDISRILSEANIEMHVRIDLVEYGSLENADTSRDIFE